MNNIAVFAHRGASGDYPENTMPAFRKAAEMNVDYIETDIHFTKDNKFVVIHDDTIDRITEGSGYVSDYTLEDLKKFDAAYNFTVDEGHSFPFRGREIKLLSLEEMLQSFPQQKFNIDLKDRNVNQVKYFTGILNRCRAFDRVIVASGYYSNLRAVRKLCPGISTSFSVKEILILLILHFSGFLFLKTNFKGNAVQVPERWKIFRIVTPKFIERLHKKNLKIHVWTVNDKDDIRRLIDLKVDGIMSDNPALLMEVLGK
ncbi:MAG: glycerophosphodiester phosphodiesterase [Spirochaetes bacterium]|nr:glycerophosphodiester phosphodiesterase [Spirochaetota bacterium]